MKNIYNLILLSALFISNSLFSTILNVPANYATIQSAINASVNGDTVVVAPGTYFENINFRGKNIVVTSQYYLAQNTSFIGSTIINGSTPAFADTASCVIFNHNETSAAILQGFTLTGGKGTKWLDIHGAGTYREGGGIIVELCSPTIKHNLIINNLVTNTTGVSGVGGGGIRIGDGNPTICSNAIIFNQAGYGPGVVLNYTGVKLTNNVIASNTGGNSYNGGSGVWAVNNLSTTPIIIENNTIVNNYSSLTTGTGSILVWGCNNVLIHNNIIYGNLPAVQVKSITIAPAVTYCNIQGGYAGTGNINQNPMFSANNYYLANGSPCIDAGDPAIVYNDIQDPANLGNALFPSLALLNNDMGAYGGPCTSVLPPFTTVTELKKTLENINDLSVFPNPASSSFEIIFHSQDAQQIKIELYTILGEYVSTISNEKAVQGKNTFQMDKTGLANGTYFVKISDQSNYSKTVKLVFVE
ncbi:MAG: T9SS type A sorting domain-containing protein [Bacteroidetes bacterium]|nr:T9SS type A sorting domain-containing protein [Bacteroidota bacterium]